MTKQQFKRVHNELSKTIFDAYEELANIKCQFIEQYKPFNVGDKVIVEKNDFRKNKLVGYVIGFEIKYKLKNGAYITVDKNSIVELYDAEQLEVLPIVSQAKNDGNPSKQKRVVYYAPERGESVVLYNEEEHGI